MSRFLLLVLLFVWMARTGTPLNSEAAGIMPQWLGVLLFLAVNALLVLGMAVWARQICRRPGGNFERRLDRFQSFIQYARYALVAWLGVAIFGGLEWGYFVDNLLDFGQSAHGHSGYEMPGLLLGIGPSLLTWMALWWAQYPVERAMSEQHILLRFDDNMPVHEPPTFWQFVVSRVRLQVLFLLTPVLLLVAAHDIAVLVISHLSGHWAANNDLEQWVMLPVAAVLYVMAPELLRRVAHSEPLADGPLRRRLEAMCRRAGLKYRDILLWKTQHTMSNAFVMGLFPRVRYVLLSDLLLETMNDKQIEAVFAHELGHVVHRHLWWLLLTIITVFCFIAGPIDQLQHLLPLIGHGWAAAVMDFALGGLGTLAVVGCLSRRFERQADVFAARTMQQERAGAVEPLPTMPTLRHFLSEEVPPLLATSFVPFMRRRARASSDPRNSHVGEYGAEIFASALRRVAEINNMPLDSWDLLHPNIAKRMRYLREMSGDPQRTRLFDRNMRRLYLALLAAVLFLGAWAAAESTQPEAAGSHGSHVEVTQ